MCITKNFRFKVGLDVDDVLLPCIVQAVEWANRDYKFDPILTVEEVRTWSASGTRADIILEYFNKEAFFKSQKPLEGAKEFVKKLSKKAEIFIVTAIEPKFMGIRVEQIKKFFPEIDEKNIIPAYRKDIVDLDFLFDDGAHNILASNVKYPVLFRRPWNAHMTGTLAANSYDEFLSTLDSIKASYLDSNITFSRPMVIALVGPSGSGKTAIATELLMHERFDKPISATTREPRFGEPLDAYDFISNEKFEQMKKNQEFAETTVYAGSCYGAELASINTILKDGKHCVIPIDISGAMALRMQYRTCIIYIKRERPQLIDTLIQRVIDGVSTKEDITKRIVSLGDEKKNEEVCDYTLNNVGTIKEVTQNLLDTMKIR